MVTQLDVAKKAGVSFITVSRVINNMGNVKEETRDRVLKAIEELRYYPNSLGRGLNSNKVNTIGIIVAPLERVNIHGSSYYSELLSGIEASCTENSFDMLISTQKKSFEKEYDYLRLYFERKVDGLILVAPDLNDAQMKEIETRQVPCVVLCDRSEKYRISYIDADNRGGMYQLGEYLIQKGHDKIGFIKGRTGNRNADDRLAGFLDLMKSYDLSIPEQWIVDGTFSVDSGRNALRHLMTFGDLPTALLCADDLIAIGVIAEAKSLGLRVPGDLSVVGFDGIPTYNFILHPLLTSARQPLEKMGCTAAEVLFRMLKDPNQKPEVHIFPVELIHGQTTSVCQTIA